MTNRRRFGAFLVAMFNRIRHITSANNQLKTEQYPYIPQPGKTKLKCLLTVGVRCFVTYLTYTSPEPHQKQNTGSRGVGRTFLME